MINPLNFEPVAIVNVVRLLLLAAATFGLELTNAQLIASMTALEAILTLFTRSQVTSANSLAAMAPKDLAKAQATPQPVQDVVKKLP
jgi:hypothetical protein